MTTDTQRATSTKQIHLTRRSQHYWRVAFDHPPLNIFGPDTIPQLSEVVTAIETDADLKVVVFESAVKGVFLTHYDFLAKLEDTTRLVSHRGRQGCSLCPTCWCGLVVLQWCRSRQSADAPLVSEVNLPWPATCASRAVKKRSCRTLKLGLAWDQAAVQWHGSRA